MRAASAIARRAFADARIRTGSFALLFLFVAYVNPVGYRHSYPTAADRLAFAQSFGVNKVVQLFYGVPHDLLSVEGLQRLEGRRRRLDLRRRLGADGGRRGPSRRGGRGSPGARRRGRDQQARRLPGGFGRDRRRCLRPVACARDRVLRRPPRAHRLLLPGPRRCLHDPGLRRCRRSRQPDRADPAVRSRARRARCSVSRSCYA